MTTRDLRCEHADERCLFWIIRREAQVVGKTQAARQRVDGVAQCLGVSSLSFVGAFAEDLKEELEEEEFV